MDYNKFRNEIVTKKAIDIFNDFVKEYTIKDKIDRNKLINLKYIGSGYTSDVYELSNEFIVKIYKDKIIARNFIKKLNNLLEIYVNKKINNIISNNICPNFVNCYMSSEKPTFFILEKEDGDLKEFLKNIIHQNNINKDNIKHYVKLFKTMIFQILIGILYLNNYLDIYHNDLKTNNIFFKKINENTVFKYIFNDNIYYIPTYGYLFMIGDFGSSLSSIYVSKIKSVIDTDEYLLKKIREKQTMKFSKNIEIYKHIKIIHHRLLKPFFKKITKTESLDDFKNTMIPQYISLETYENILKNLSSSDNKYSELLHYIIINKLIDLHLIVPKYILKLFNKIDTFINNIFEKVEKKNNLSKFIRFYKKYKKVIDDNKFNITTFTIMSIHKNIYDNLKYRSNRIDIYNLKNIDKCLKETNNKYNIDTINKNLTKIDFPESKRYESNICGHSTYISYKNKPDSMTIEERNDIFNSKKNIYSKTNNLIDNNTCPHFIYNYLIDDNEYYYIIEYFDYSLYNFLIFFITKYNTNQYVTETFNIIKSLIFQILITLLCIDKYLNINNPYIRISNILIKHTQNNNIFQYIINNKYYYVNTFGYLISIDIFDDINDSHKLNNNELYKIFKSIITKIYMRILKNNNINNINKLYDIISPENKLKVEKIIVENTHKIKDYLMMKKKLNIEKDMMYYTFQYAALYIVKNKMIDLKNYVLSEFLDEINKIKIFLKELFNNDYSIDKLINVFFTEYEIEKNVNKTFKIVY